MTPDTPITYQPLGPTFSKNGYHYALVSRKGDVAIYAQSHKQSATPVANPDAYEVFIVKKTPEQKAFGTILPARESVPSNEEWGTKGWTYVTLEEAEDKMRMVIKALRSKTK